METIVSFCASCGSYLPEGVGRKIDQECENCGNLVIDRDQRLEGSFLDTEGGRMKEIYEEQ